MIATIFFPAAHTIGTAPPLHGTVSLFADRFARRKFGDMIHSDRHALLAAQYLSDSRTAYSFVSRQ